MIDLLIGTFLGGLAVYLVMRFRTETPAKQAADAATLQALEQRAEAIATNAAAKVVAVTRAAHTEAVKVLTEQMRGS